ncbi:MAG: glycosyltransferase [Candidatus Stygibacter australis]|nr:glycosyltransferase [Candidatus Stygibacter australis]MDP8322886.1 glycosyltransferase [Candidatus Stygibacter australis]
MKLIKLNNIYDITFVCRKDYDHFAQPILKELEKKYRIQYLYLNHKLEYWHFLVRGRVIWVEWANKFALTVSKKRWKNKKLIIRLHRYEILSKYMNKITWGNVNKLVFVNEHFENEFKEKISSEVNAITIPNAIDIDSFPSLPHLYGKSICAYGFGFDPIKGYDQLINMFGKLVKRDPDFHLTIMGMITKQDTSIRHLKEIKDQIIALGLVENISIIERQCVDSLVDDRSNVVSFLQNHDIIMSYSHTESFHYAFAEGMLCGLEGFYNMWHNSLIKNYWRNWGYGSEEELIDSIIKWTNLSQLEKERKAQENREYIINNFSSEVISKKYEKIFWE